MIKLRSLLSETSLRTKHGSSIKRYKNNVGKQVGSQIYVHKLYADEIVPKALLQKAEHKLTTSNPDFDYNTIMFDPKQGVIRFDQASDFDSAREPHVGDYIIVYINGERPLQVGHSDSIWHHKWLWVKDDYTGFNVDKSKEWSRIWLAKLDEPAKGTDLTWNSQLRNVGLDNKIEKISEQLFLNEVLHYVSKDVIVGSINDENDIIGDDEVKTHGYLFREFPHYECDCDRNDWRYNKPRKTLYWWDSNVNKDKVKLVVQWLANRGYTVNQHKSLEIDDPISFEDEKFHSHGGYSGKQSTPIEETNMELPPVILGAIWPDEEIKAIKGVNDDSRHPFEWSACKKWRYVPEIHYLTWWERPTPIEKELVQTYLGSKGFKVKRSVVLTLRENNASKNDMVYGGIWSTGKIVSVTNSNGHGHSREMGRNRWIYREHPGVVFWHIYPQDDDTKFQVENYLTHKGYNVHSHRSMKDYYKLMGYIDENKKIQIMENVTQEQATAAIDFLKGMVRKGPFNGKVFLAGGPVRDMIMGRIPKDLDVSVVGNGLRGGLDFAIWIAKQMGNYKGPENYPPQFNFAPHIEVDSYGAPSFSPKGEPNNPDPDLAKAIEEYDSYYASFSNPVLFPKFGTAKVFLSGTHNGISLEGVDIEAVASRREEYTLGSRKPKVFPGTLKDDVFRRDFTTNSLMMDLTTDKIHDLTGHGIQDIKAGILKTTSDPEVIFKEDPLRMLRAVRFMVQKGWKIDSNTEASIRKNASWLKSISKERVRDELNKMLVTSNPSDALRKLRDLGLLQYISPELQQAVGMTQNVHHVHDVFDHTLEVLKNTKPELVQRLMALFHDIGKIATRSETPTGVHFYGHEEEGEKMVDQILRNLKYPIEIINAVKSGVKNHMRLKQGGNDAVKLSDKTLRKFKMELGDNLEHVLDVIHADNIAHADASAMPSQIENVRKRLQSLDVQVKKPSLPISGNDLLQLGVPQGRMVGQILSAVTDAWFENPNITRDDAIAIAKRMI